VTSSQSFSIYEKQMTMSKYSPSLDISYDKAAIIENHSLGLLLLHLHNIGNTAQVLDFTYRIDLP
jgi:hypothetical protein